MDIIRNPALADLDESNDAPPAYTPSPSVNDGEETIEYGPHRPFQSAPPASPWSVSSHLNVEPLASHGRYLSDFARDFYASGSGSNLSSAPVGSPYRPPSAPPPGSSMSASASQSQMDSRKAGLKVTSTPTPGCVLSNKGRILYYPEGFECRYCHNTGYRNFDPSHPCRKCWDDYSQTYNSNLSSSSNISSIARHQRPLPAFRPPQRSFISNEPSSSHSINGLRNSNPAQLQRTLQPAPQVQWAAKAPQGALVVQPGDPRIGGRICWRCDGQGTLSLLFFDREQCPVCHGIGRLLDSQT